MYEVKLSKQATKILQKLPHNVKYRIDQKLEYLRVSPRGHDTKKMVGEENQYRTRVGEYRILFEIRDKELIVWVVDIGQRGEIYK